MSNLSVSQAESRLAPSSIVRPTVLVTGGSRGIGQAICLEFGRAGWRVGVHYRERKEDAARTAATVTANGGEGFSYQADIGDARQVEAMVQEFVTRWGRLDVLVCNAGRATSGLVVRVRPDEWKAVIETNLTGTFHCLKAAASHLLAQGSGSVIVVSSFAGVQGRAGQSAYAASKAGLLGLVKTAAREWGRSNVRVNAIFPGWHRTELSEPALLSVDGFENHVLGRSPDLDAVARSVYHLALLKDVSGQVWNLDSRMIASV
ncbi:MAG TPA: SDR family oxidoreductase [Nitrospiraceae bacterium]|nr:SDR family oxidoreductase [Nitrospiraceae bacterium]